MNTDNLSITRNGELFMTITRKLERLWYVDESTISNVNFGYTLSTPIHTVPLLYPTHILIE